MEKEFYSQTLYEVRRVFCCVNQYRWL